MNRLLLVLCVLPLLVGCAAMPTFNDDAFNDLELQAQLIRTTAITAIVLADDPALAGNLSVIANDVLALLADPNATISDLVVKACDGRLDARAKMILAESLNTFNKFYDTPPTLREFIGDNNLVRLDAFWRGVKDGSEAYLQQIHPQG